MTILVHPVGEPIAVDGGYSGQITVSAGRPNPGVSAPTLVFVEADLVSTRLVLTEAEAHELGMTLVRMGDRVRRDRQEGRLT